MERTMEMVVKVIGGEPGVTMDINSEGVRESYSGGLREDRGIGGSSMRISPPKADVCSTSQYETRVENVNITQ